MFNIMHNTNVSSGVANYSGLPMLEALGALVPCWNFPNHTDHGPTPAGFSQHGWCGAPGKMGMDVRLPCYADGSCGKLPGASGEGFS